MTVIVWTPQGMAADKQASNQGTLCTTTKLWRFEYGDEVYGLAVCGDSDWGLELVDWFKATLGANPATYPQNDKEFKARLIVGTRDRLFDYCNRGHPTQILDPYMAFGSGRDAALGALYMGATARQAVEAASYHEECCGRGVDEVAFPPSEVWNLDMRKVARAV